jgi:hypothetical protein
VTSFADRLRAAGLDPAGYWLPTERREAVAAFHDGKAAAAMNADNLLTDAEPFGSLPGAEGRPR